MNWLAPRRVLDPFWRREAVKHKRMVRVIGEKKMAEQVVDLAQRTDRAGKYLTFFLARQEYGVEILKVREIIGMVQITPVPRTPEFVRGVINLRGKVIPVIDLRSKFDMEPADQTGETCVIVEIGRASCRERV